MKNENEDKQTIELSLTPRNYNGDQNTFFTSTTIPLGAIPQTIKAKNFSTIKWRGGSRKGKNFLYATGFTADVDTGLSIHEAQERLEQAGLNYVLAPSKSHTPEQHKFHVLLPFSHRVWSPSTYQNIAKHISGEILPGSDRAVTDTARFIYGSPDHTDITTNFGDKNIDVTKFGPLWDSSLMITTARGVEIKAVDLDIKTPIHCPFHADESPSAFVDYAKDSRNWYIHCTACDKTTFWMEKQVTDNPDSFESYWSYGTDVWEMGIKGDDFYIERIGRPKFHILTDTISKEKRDPAFGRLVRRKHISHLTRIDYLGDINAQEHYYQVNPESGIIEVHYSAIPVKDQDNTFVEDYFADRFGQHKGFIKQWLAVFCYSNYLKVPTLILKGPRGNGKSTFAEIIGEIFRPLTFEWHGHEQDFTYEVEKKLLIVEENETSTMSQYKTLKKYSGQKYAQVKKKFKDPYSVRNNMSMVMLTNENIPLYVSREEEPTDDRNNQFFVYEFPPISGALDNQIQQKLVDRLGHYVRTELKTVWGSLDTSGYRYSISVPITDEEMALFQDNVTDLEADADKYLQKMVLYKMEKNSAYEEFLNAGYVPTQFFKDFDISPKNYNRVIKNLKKRRYLKGEAVRIQHDKDRHYCYQMTEKLIKQISEAKFTEIDE